VGYLAFAVVAWATGHLWPADWVRPLHRRPELRTIGRITAVLVGARYCLSGIDVLRSSSM
jgi:hypothetical protein